MLEMIAQTLLAGFLQLTGFCVGVHLTITLLGSLYRLIDLGYRLSDFWLPVIARIFLNGGIIFLVYFLSSGNFELGFWVGQCFFLIFHISIFWVGQFALFLLHRR
ncbi:MAG: hypothetical protein ACJAYE_002236 [Candidatus Azotimanducaceae bacterium]|jgi:hypothetical protein